ncbi:hypothetical protein M5W78_17565, partial [Paenibacillus larvae]|uniref:hypothetical protein n=1 Tax=Paenibacillus larvae TaxID=1464 RepID=UPI00227DE098
RLPLCGGGLHFGIYRRSLIAPNEAHFLLLKNRRGHMEMQFSLISEKIYAPLGIFKIIVEV